MSARLRIAVLPGGNVVIPAIDVIKLLEDRGENAEAKKLHDKIESSVSTTVPALTVVGGN